MVQHTQSKRQIRRRSRRRIQDETLLHQQTDQSLQLQRAIKAPSEQTLTPEVIQQLQSSHGNTFVNALVQQSRQKNNTPSNGLPVTTIQRWVSATPTKGPAPTFDPIVADNFALMDKFKGLKTAKKSIKKPQKLIEQIQGGNTAQTAEETMTEHGGIVSENAGSLVAALQGGDIMTAMGPLQAINAILGQYIGLAKTIIKFVMSIKKTIEAFKTRKALAKAVKALKQKVADGTASPDEDNVFQSSSYGLAKVTRRFVESIAKTVILLGKAISTWVTFFTGGTTAVFTGVVDLLTSSAQSALKGYRAGKAIYKQRKGTKGVARAENAQTLIESALNNQPDALQLMISLKVGNLVFQNKKKKKLVNGKFPKTATEMAMFLRTLNDKELNIMRDELKNKLSSAVYRSSVEKGKLKNYKKRAKKGTLPV